MKGSVPEGMWLRCPQCKATIFRKEAENRCNVCPECSYHFYVSARERIRQLLDGRGIDDRPSLAGPSRAVHEHCFKRGLAEDTAT